MDEMDARVNARVEAHEAELNPVIDKLQSLPIRKQRELLLYLLEEVRISVSHTAASAAMDALDEVDMQDVLVEAFDEAKLNDFRRVFKADK